MPLLRVGTRDDVERAIKMVFVLPAILICPLAAAGLLKDRMPVFLAFVLGGMVGGAISYPIGEGAVRLTRLMWPPRTESQTSED